MRLFFNNENILSPFTCIIIFCTIRLYFGTEHSSSSFNWIQHGRCLLCGRKRFLLKMSSKLHNEFQGWQIFKAREFLYCCNIFGSPKRKLLFIDKSSEPRCFNIIKSNSDCLFPILNLPLKIVALEDRPQEATKSY